METISNAITEGSSWDEDEDNTVEQSDDTIISTTNDNDKVKQNKNNNPDYHLTSLFGNETISSGPDMFDDVLSTLSKQNPIQHDTILLLSPYTTAELIAIRRIIALYPDKKLIVFNCKLDKNNYPREFLYSEMVYSILPLLARRERNDGLFGTTDEGGSEEGAPKILVMRRFPQDWEIYMDDGGGDDVGSGFELVESFDSESFDSESFDSESFVSKHGPSMDVIVACVKRYLQGKAFSSTVVDN